VIVKQVATVTSGWQPLARQRGASTAEIRRMTSAFEHGDLIKALAL
jgi:serine/threonine-protein kinase HipA